MKKINFIFLIFFAVILRLLFIDKAQGLWNDEYVSWMISQKPFNEGFWQAVWAQCHMPFYYLYLKFLTLLFGNDDLFLRFTSLVPNIIAIPVMYLVGKEYNGRIVGRYCAVFCTISSFLIFYSQEVRLYSLLFLFSAISLLFTFKIVKSPGKKNILGYVISNFFILFTHTIGFVYLFFNLLYVSYKLYKLFKKQVIILWSIILSSGLILSLQVVKILTERTFSQWWGYFTPSKILFVFSDYFSPWLVNLTNSPDNFFYEPTIAFYLFCVLPLIIAFTLLTWSLLRRENLEIFSVALFTLLVLVIAATNGKLVLLTKYSIEIYPILILLVCSGLSYCKNKFVRRFIALFYIFLCLTFMVISPKSAQKMPRPEGHKIVADMLYNCHLNKDDIILITYYANDRFRKYYDFSPYKNFSINKGNFFEYMSENGSYEKAYKDGHNLYKPVFTGGLNEFLAKKLDSEIISKIKLGQNLVVVNFEGVSMLTDEKINKIANDNEFYEKVPIMYLIFSHIKNQTINQFLKNLEMTGFQSGGSWSVVKFTKVNK